MNMLGVLPISKKKSLKDYLGARGNRIRISREADKDLNAL